jgi:hypothetical protein
MGKPQGFNQVHQKAKRFYLEEVKLILENYTRQLKNIAENI